MVYPIWVATLQNRLLNSGSLNVISFRGRGTYPGGKAWAYHSLWSFLLHFPTLETPWLVRGLSGVQGTREHAAPGLGDVTVSRWWLGAGTISVYASPFLQMEALTPGGLAKPTRSITTGEALGLEFRNVPAASSATARTPDTTATVTRITSSGECRGRACELPSQPAWRPD